MQERGVEVDHSTLNRWMLKYVPLLDKQFRACKQLVGSSWRMAEIYLRCEVSAFWIRTAADTDRNHSLGL